MRNLQTDPPRHEYHVAPGAHTSFFIHVSDALIRRCLKLLTQDDFSARSTWLTVGNNAPWPATVPLGLCGILRSCTWFLLPTSTGSEFYATLVRPSSIVVLVLSQFFFGRIMIFSLYATPRSFGTYQAMPLLTSDTEQTMIYGKHCKIMVRTIDRKNIFVSIFYTNNQSLPIGLLIPTWSPVRRAACVCSTRLFQMPRLRPSAKLACSQKESSRGSSTAPPVITPSAAIFAIFAHPLHQPTSLDSTLFY